MNNTAVNILVSFFGCTCACISVVVEVLPYKARVMFSFSRCFQFSKVVICFTLPPVMSPTAMSSSCSTSASTFFTVRSFSF